MTYKEQRTANHLRNLAKHRIQKQLRTLGGGSNVAVDVLDIVLIAELLQHFAKLSCLLIRNFLNTQRAHVNNKGISVVDFLLLFMNVNGGRLCYTYGR